MTLNDRAVRLADRLAADAETLRIGVSRTPAGARVLDCGVQALGGLAAGYGLLYRSYAHGDVKDAETKVAQVAKKVSEAESQFTAAKSRAEAEGVSDRVQFQHVIAHRGEGDYA